MAKKETDHQNHYNTQNTRSISKYHAATCYAAHSNSVTLNLVAHIQGKRDRIEVKTIGTFQPSSCDTDIQND